MREKILDPVQVHIAVILVLTVRQTPKRSTMPLQRIAFGSITLSILKKSAMSVKSEKLGPIVVVTVRQAPKYHVTSMGCFRLNYIIHA